MVKTERHYSNSYWLGRFYAFLHVVFSLHQVVTQYNIYHEVVRIHCIDCGKEFYGGERRIVKIGRSVPMSTSTNSYNSSV